MKTKENNTKKRNTFLTAIICLGIFTLICGVIYPLSVTLVAQTVFPYEANGSQIIVTLKDGTQKVYGSEHIGQNFENPKYLLGRVNLGSPTNISPESDEFKASVKEQVEIRKNKLASFGYEDKDDIPDELLTTSGSGVDPHISVQTAYFQINTIVYARKADGEDITYDQVKNLIDKYTENRFLFIFGEKRVNVLLVNLALDGLI